MNRKDLIRQYKETPPPAGVFRIYNNEKKISFIGSSLNIPGVINRQKFQLKNGSHPDKQLQQDWNDLGPDPFIFETLDELDLSVENNSDPEKDLKTLKQLWLDKLRDSGETIYPGSLRYL